MNRALPVLIGCVPVNSSKRYGNEAINFFISNCRYVFLR